MVKTIALAFAALAATFCSTDASVAKKSVNESCSLIDFTAQETQFLLLNNAVDVATQSTLLSKLVKGYDPLVLQNIHLGEFSYSILGQDLKFTPTLDHLNVTGLASIVPKHINASSASGVHLGAYSNAELAIDATVSLKLEELDSSFTVDVSLKLSKPTLATSVKAVMYGCAVGASKCHDFTVTTIEVAAVDDKYSSILDPLLLRFKSAAIQTVTLDFEAIVSRDFSFHSSGAVISAITDALAGFSTRQVNKKGSAYKSFTSAIDSQLLSVANDYINSKLKPRFGATCMDA